MIGIVQEAVITFRRNGVPSRPFTTIPVMRDFLRKVIPDGPCEYGVVIPLTSNLQPVAWYVASKGGPVSAAVDVSDVLRFVLLTGESQFVFAHNHPSGLARPSDADEKLTKRLGKAAHLLGVTLIDHVILGEGAAHYSFKLGGLL